MWFFCMNVGYRNQAFSYILKQLGFSDTNMQSWACHLIIDMNYNYEDVMEHLIAYC